MRKTSKIAVVGTSVAVLMGAGIAYAAWTSTGTGSASAIAGTDQGLTVAGGTATGLFPTGTRTVTVTVTNKNPYMVAVDSVVPGVATVAGATGKCTADVVSTSVKNGLADTLAAAGATGDSMMYTFSYVMSNAAEDGCQGATFTIPFTATGHSTS